MMYQFAPGTYQLTPVRGLLIHIEVAYFLPFFDYNCHFTYHFVTQFNAQIYQRILYVESFIENFFQQLTLKIVELVSTSPGLPCTTDKATLNRKVFFRKSFQH
jgi:hypothetical protein